MENALRLSSIIPNEISTLEFRHNFGVIRVSEFTEDSAKAFSEEMREAHASGQPVIPVIIDSYGGQVDSLNSMISDIRHSEKPVATITVGKAMSCGAVLLSAGTLGYRYADPLARIMIHEVASGDYGKTADLKVSTEETDALNIRMLQMLARNCNKRPDYFIKLMAKRKNTDWFMTADEAKSHGLVEKLFVPKLTREVKIEYTFG